MTLSFRGSEDTSEDIPMRALRNEQKFLARDMTAELEVASVDGSFVIDSHGKRYIDFVMGWCVGNLGWNHSEIVKSLENFEGPDYIYPGYAYQPWDELAERLVSISPRGLTRCFRATGGSEAVDIALQAAMVHTGRKKFLSLEESYHGNSLGGLSIGDSEHRRICKNLLPH